LSQNRLSAANFVTTCSAWRASLLGNREDDQRSAQVPSPFVPAEGSAVESTTAKQLDGASTVFSLTFVRNLIGFRSLRFVCVSARNTSFALTAS
jgi:hypothetical protein